MDKDLVNNQIILMRKVVRPVKRLVKQKLTKQMKVLEIRLNKKLEKTTKKLENKMNNKKKELIAINGVNVDEVSKLALIQTKKYFEDILKNGQSSPESKAMARVAINDNITKVVNKFKEENPNCDQWLPSQIELWQQKKLIKKNKVMNKTENTDKTEPKVNESKEKSVETIKNKSESKSSETIETKKPQKEKKVVKKEKTKVVDKMVPAVEEEKPLEETKPKSDPFFLSKDSNLDESDDNSDAEERQRFSNRNFKNQRFGRNEKSSKFSKMSAKSHSFEKKNFKPKKFENKPQNREVTNKGKEAQEENLHPSWAAKRKDKLKIDLSKPLAKKIKFSDQ